MKRRVSSCSWVLLQVSCRLLSVVKSEVSSTLPDEVLHGSQVHIRNQQLKEKNTLSSYTYLRYLLRDLFKRSIP